MLHHETTGAGRRACLLLHGFLGSGRNLRSLARRLAERDEELTIVRPDLTGHGRSPPLAEDADLFTVARDVFDLARSLRVEGPLTVIGHSLGGRVALAMRKEAPDRIAGVTLLDVAPGPITWTGAGEVARAALDAPDRAATREEMGEALRSRGLSEALAKWLLTNVDRTEQGFAWRIDRAALLRFHERTSDTDLWSAVTPSIRCIRGGASAYVTDEDVAGFEARGARLDTLEGAGHFIHVDALDALVEKLLEDHGLKAPSGEAD